MKKSDPKKLLMEQVKQLQDASEWLKRSYEQCEYFDIESISADEQDLVEAFTARYARVIDMLIQKVYRGIDYVEMEKSGTLIDVVNRAAKRGLVDSANAVRDLKDLRNLINHEYATKDVNAIFTQVRDVVPKLLEWVDAACQYVVKMGD
ncbi:MAG: hypothetical protein P1U63_02560 [Coxiellaceae bacterium]|nr:hypothetical protein [Coxiellaceae bacterium]